MKINIIMKNGFFNKIELFTMTQAISKLLWRRKNI